MAYRETYHPLGTLDAEGVISFPSSSVLETEIERDYYPQRIMAGAINSTMFAYNDPIYHFTTRGPVTMQMIEARPAVRRKTLYLYEENGQVQAIAIGFRSEDRDLIAEFFKGDGGAALTLELESDEVEVKWIGGTRG